MKLYKNLSFSFPTMILSLGIISVSTASLMIRFAQRDAPSLVIAVYRLGIAVIILAPFALLRYKQDLLAITKKQWGILVIAGLFLALHFAAWITSLENTTIASSVVLTTSVPLWVSIVSPFILHEKLSKIVILGIFIALLGGTIVGIANLTGTTGLITIFPHSSNIFSGKQAYGNFLAVFGAWMSAGYLMIGRGVRRKIALVPYTFIVYGTAAIFLLVMVFYSGEKMIGFPFETYGWLIGLAVIPQLLGHSAFNWALRYLSATYVAVALLGEPIGATLLGILFIKEIPSYLEIIGGIFILLGIYVVSRSEKS